MICATSSLQAAAREEDKKRNAQKKKREREKDPVRSRKTAVIVSEWMDGWMVSDMMEGESKCLAG